ncbi:MAG: protein kinase [Holophagae bacterium]|nr:protein kinase [Holophagae bacterium]
MKPTIQIPGLQIEKKLAQGGQGEIFVAVKNGKQYALKLYFEKNSTTDQRRIIEQLILSGPPDMERPDPFVWPMEVVELPGGRRFGYLMPLIQTSRYISLAQIESGKLKHPGYRIMAEACRQLAECYRELHIEGYCYRDISKFNVMFSPKNGDVVICDNDNIIVNKYGPGKIGGTTQYMAPEVILGKARPSTATDHHSLAVLLFMFICGGHPFHGQMEDKIKIFDGVAAEYLYGHKPVFIFNPLDHSNNLPEKRGYRHVKRQWQVLPNHIQALFVRALVTGTRNPANRVTDIEWMAAFTQLLGQCHICSCGAENFWDPRSNLQQRRCWHKGCTVSYPPKLQITGKSSCALLIKAGQQVTAIHLGEKSGSRIVGEMECHPSNASVLVLRNKTHDAWMASLGSQQVEIPAGRAAPLHPGTRIKTTKHEFIVCP